MSLNSVNILGNLTRDPELKYTSTGKSVASLSIANNRIYTKGTERVQEVSYFDVEVWGAVAENCAKYLSKGSGIVVEGRLKQDRWEKEGKTQTKVRIVANNIHFLPKKSNEAGNPSAQNAASPAMNNTSPAPAQASGVDNIAWDE